MNILPPGMSIFLNFLSKFEKMKRRLKSNLLPGAILILALLYLGTARLPAVTFTASLDRDTIALGETAILTLRFEGGQPKLISPLPAIPNLQMADRGSSQSINIVNTQMSSSISETYELTPTRTGEYSIPALRAEVGGQMLTSLPVTLTVTAPNTSPSAGGNPSSQVAFMKLTLSKNKVFVGEVITAQLELYFRQDVQNYGNFQITALPADGFTSGKLVEGQHRRVQIGNAAYTLVPAAFTLTAQKTGPVSVGPATASVVVVLPSSNQGGDSFFRQFFNTGEQRQVSLAADAQTAQSFPLPTEGKPANFNGAIGNYNMAVSAGPTNVAVGDPITVHVQISGRGALDALTLPDQPAWRDFKTYPPTSRVETSDALGLQGAKTFEQIVTPQNTDVHELPAFSFSCFDPDAGAYRTLTEPPVQLAVHSAGTTPAPMIAVTKMANPQAPPPDLLPIKEQFGTAGPAGPPLLTQPVFLAAQSLPVLAWLAAFVWRKRTDRLANNPRLRRQRHVARLVRDGLNDLRRLAAENKSDEFFATLFRLLQEQLGERLDCPASSITEAVIDERLARRSAPEATLAALRELFQLCNQARYAPLRSSGELAAVIPQFENAVRGLQNVKA
jgi:hypothetical protein